MNKNWHTRRKDVYRWIKGGHTTPIVMLSRDDDTLTANIQAMGSRVREARVPKMRKCVSNPQLDDEEFMRECGRHVHGRYTDTPDHRRSFEQAAVKINLSTPTGVDGRPARDVQCMSLQLWDSRADVLILVEETSVWPSRLAEGFTSLVPEGTEPLQLRPLSVVSVIYRIWAGFRLEDAWSTPCLTGTCGGIPADKGPISDAGSVLLKLSMAGRQGILQPRQPPHQLINQLVLVAWG